MLSPQKHRVSTQKITLGLSFHRPEMIPLIADRMRCHDAIFLEEPPADGFEPKLAGTLAVDDYLRPLDVEYPAFSRDMCHLLRELRAKGKKIFQVKHLADEALKTMGDKGHLYGPGDQLTLLYVFHPNLAETRREAFLAARSIIFSKISEKEELTDDLDRFPHLSDELACIRTTQQLGLDDYRRLFPLVRRAKSSDARQLVARHLAEDGKAAGKPEIYVCGEYGSVPGIQWALLSGRQTAEEVLKIMNTNR